MTRGGILVFSGGLAVVALVLAGCTAPTPTPTPAPTASPIGAASSTPEATPTASPTPTAVAGPPVVRVPFDCADLFTTATAKKLVGVSLSADGGKTAPLNNMGDLAQRQSGALDCTWEGSQGADQFAAYFLHISIAPGAASDYATYLAKIQPAKYSPVTNTFGDKSSYYCDEKATSYAGYYCTGELVVGTSWASVSISHKTPVTAAGATSAITVAMAKTATSLEAAGTPSPAWTLPAGTPSTICTNTATTARMRTALGDPSIKHVGGKLDFFPSAAVVGIKADTYASCEFLGSKSDYTDLELLYGGSWAFPSLLKPQAPADATYGLARFAPWSVPGATSAFVGCSAGTCDAYLGVRHTAVEIVLKDSGKAATTAKLAKLIDVIES